jgi:hypothetical protein
MKDVWPREGLLQVGFELSTRRVWASACQGAMAGCVMVPLGHHAPVVTSLSVQSAGAKEKMAVVFVNTLTKVMQARQVILFAIQKFAGGLKQWRQQQQQKILMPLVICCQRRSSGMAPS